ncbi:MAG: hypothetical protein HQK51_12435 [Oligoflexia bacterium]|nr:hypothetical protein [Oligoflexia bacterium]
MSTIKEVNPYEKTLLFRLRTIFLSSDKQFIDKAKKLILKYKIESIQFEKDVRALRNTMVEASNLGYNYHLIVYDYFPSDENSKYYAKVLNLLKSDMKFRKIPMMLIKDAGITINPKDFFVNILEKVSKADENSVSVIDRTDTMETIFTHVIDVLEKYYDDNVSLFTIENSSKYQIINLPQKLDKLYIDELKRLAEKTQIENEKKLMIYNFKHYEDVSPNNIREIFRVVFGLQKLKFNCCSVFVNEEIAILMEKTYTLEMFKVKKSLKDAFKENNIPVDAPRPSGRFVSLDVEIVNPFIVATVMAYKKHLDVTLGTQGPKINNNYECSNAAFAIAIKIESTKFNGTILQIFKTDVFSNFMKLVREKYNLSDLKEFIIFTHKMVMEIFEMAKSDLIKRSNYELDKATPEIIQRSENIKKAIKYSTSINICLNSSLGPVDLLINPESSGQ